VPTAAVIWSPCGAEGILNVNNRISLAANTTSGTGELTNDDATISFEHQVHVSWQACTDTGATGGGGFTTGGGSVNIAPREADPQDFTVYPGTTVVTPGSTGGGSTVVTPGSTGGGTVVITPGDDDGSTIVTPGKA